MAHTSTGPPRVPLSLAPPGGDLERTQSTYPRKPRPRIQFNLSERKPLEVDHPPCWGTHVASSVSPGASLLASKVFKDFPGIGCQTELLQTNLAPGCSPIFTFCSWTCPLPSSPTDPFAVLHTVLPSWLPFPQRGRGLSGTTQLPPKPLTPHLPVLALHHASEPPSFPHPSKLSSELPPFRNPSDRANLGACFLSACSTGPSGLDCSLSEQSLPAQ